MRIHFNNYWGWATVLYVLALTALSLRPRYDPPPEPVPLEPSSGLLPKEGDNFKIVNDVVVYRLENGKRRQYKTSPSYLMRPENPPYGTPYEEGGILYVDSFVRYLHPRGEDMPRLKDTTSVVLAPPPSGPPLWYTYTRWDKLGHLLVYAGLGLLLWWSFRQWNTSRKRRFGTVLLLGSVVGWGLEWAQGLMNAGRDAEWADLVMNTIGLCVGASVAYWAAAKHRRP